MNFKKPREDRSVGFWLRVSGRVVFVVAGTAWHAGATFVLIVADAWAPVTNASTDEWIHSASRVMTWLLHFMPASPSDDGYRFIAVLLLNGLAWSVAGLALLELFGRLVVMLLRWAGLIEPRPRADARPGGFPIDPPLPVGGQLEMP